MRNFPAALPLLAALGACAALPSDPPLDPRPARQAEPAAAGYRAIGTEPFWDLSIGRELVFSDRGRSVQVVQLAPRPIIGIAGETYRTARIAATIVHARCSDGMSDRTYPDQVQVRVDGRDYRGCGAAAAFFASQAAPLPQPRLAQTRWRVVTINGRAVPAVGYFIDFAATRLSAKFGCNGIGASYRVTRDLLRAGPAMATRMACAEMSFENAGSAVLAVPMTIANVGGTLTLSNQNGAIAMVPRP